MNQNDVLLRKQYLKILFPLMFSVLGATINALIDSVVVSQKLGSNGLAAVNASMPLYLIMCTIGSLICGGAWILSSKHLGRENVIEANEAYNNGLCWTILIGAVITFAGAIFNAEISSLIGGDISIYNHVRQYTLVTFLGSLSFLLIYFPMFYLQLEGKGKQISTAVTIMVVADLSMDILFLFVFNWGMYGAALASVCANVFCCIYGFIVLEKEPSNFHFSFSLFRLKNLGQILKNGYSLAVTNLFDAVKLLILNLMILSLYGSRALAVWAVLNTICELSLVISSGVARAANSMLSVYKSAMENSRIRLLIKIQVETGLILSALFTLALVIFNVPISYVFKAEDSLLVPLVMVGITTILQTISDIWSGYFQVTDFAWVSSLQSLYRRLLFPVAALTVIVFSGLYLWSFLPIGALLTIVFSYLTTLFVANKNNNTDHPLTKVLLLDDYLSRNKKVIDFTLKADMEEACNASEQIAEFCMQNELSTKQSMKLQLAIEELIKIIIKKVDNIKEIDARAYAYEETIGIQFRYPGELYNPYEDDDEDLFIELNMIKKLGEENRHSYTLGLNTINFCVFTKDKNVG